MKYNVNAGMLRRLTLVCLTAGMLLQCRGVAGFEDPRYAGRQSNAGETHVELKGERYGAQQDEAGPIGGGDQYQRSLTTGQHIARTLAELRQSLREAKPGETVFLPGDVEIDVTPWVTAEGLVLDVPNSVTLASDRGVAGSRGALIFSREFDTKPMIRTTGTAVRITGLRLFGPDPELRMDWHRECFSGQQRRGHAVYYRFPAAVGIETSHAGLEVDNCELAGWSHAAVFVRRGQGHRIHHNYLHHNQRHGLGYGVCLDLATAVIHHNLMDAMRHAIAGTGRSGSGYEAHDNLVFETANSHYFDMHGGRDRGDGTNVAGGWMKIHHNTFVGNGQKAVVIRGVPELQAEIEMNWFAHANAEEAVKSDGNTLVGRNAYGRPAVPR